MFRVESPGGSAVASEVIRREVIRAKKAGKPVVVSMANVAASGGYWISADADAVVAQPGTVTGSIGVVSGKLATREAWSKAGITFDHVGFGDHSTYSLNHDPFSESERDRLETSLDTIYDDFTDLVASGRDLAKGRVEEIARGRVWTGTMAKEIGLVDELGGLSVAIEQAKKAAQIEAGDKIKLVSYPKKERRFPPVSRESSEPIRDLAAALQAMFHRLNVADIQVRMPDITFQ